MIGWLLPSTALTLMQKVKMNGVFATFVDIGIPPPVQVRPEPVAPFWVFQLVKSTKHSDEAYVPVVGRANPQVLEGVTTGASCVELTDAAGTAVRVYL